MAESHSPYTPDTWPESRSGIVFLDELIAAQLKRRRFTVEEFYRMVPASILGEDTLEELIDGDVMVRALKTDRHSAALSNLLRLFISSDTSEFSPSVQCPIRLDRYNEPIVDMALTDPDFDSDEHPVPKDMLLAIEVADTYAEVEYDRDIKLPLYARYGVRELWLVKLQSREIEAHREPTPEGYSNVQVYRSGDTLTIQELPAIELAVEELLK